MVSCRRPLKALMGLMVVCRGPSIICAQENQPEKPNVASNMKRGQDPSHNGTSSEFSSSASISSPPSGQPTKQQGVMRPSSSPSNAKKSKSSSVQTGQPSTNNTSAGKSELQQLAEEIQLEIFGDDETREQMERTSRQREERFAADLALLSPEQQKLARQRKKKDGHVVRRILLAARHGDYYGILGLRYLEVSLPARTWSLGGGRSWTWPGLSLFHVSETALTQAYREMVRAVHPDHNLDGQAPQAYRAVEKAVAMLLDPVQRPRVEKRLQAARRQAVVRAVGLVMQGVSRTIHTATSVLGSLRRILGPFAFPALILGYLLV